MTDTLASWFANGARNYGARAVCIDRVDLRAYQIAPCIGCNACLAPPYSCVLDKDEDMASSLFSRLNQATLNVFVSPIYFYALPAHFKAFIDRGQRFWANRMSKKNADFCQKPAIAILAAGRPRGEQLFSGALRTLKYFLKNFDSSVMDKFLYRGLDQPANLLERGDIVDELGASGRFWAEKLDMNI